MLSLLGSEELQARFLPDVITGQTSIALAISEPDAGSAATDVSTRAKWADGAYTVNGAKRWTSNGSEADAYLVYVRLTDEPGAKGIGALIVEADSPGVSFGARERLMGFRGIPSADIRFDDVIVPAENLVVGPGEFGKLFRAFSIERLGNSTMSLAIGQAAVDRTIAYVQERTQFGKPLIEFQNVQMILADMVHAGGGGPAAGGTGRPHGRHRAARPARGVAGQVHRQRDGQAGVRPGHAVARRQRVHRGVRP